jgi:predicted AlkP superfamily phosphohydrolase/phosphomutase
VERSRRGVSRSCLPSHSWAAWPTFLTGHDPGWHGDFDILEYRPGAMRRIPVSSRSILAPIWPDRLSEAGKTVLLLNVPLTYPPPALRGVVIAGGVVPPRTTYSYRPTSARGLAGRSTAARGRRSATAPTISSPTSKR